MYIYIYVYICIYHIYQHEHLSQVCWFPLRIHPTEKKPPQHRHHLAWQVSWLSHLCEQVDSVSTGKAGRNIEKHQKCFNMSRKSWGSLCGQIMELFLHDDRGKSWKIWDFRSHQRGTCTWVVVRQKDHLLLARWGSANDRRRCSTFVNPFGPHRISIVCPDFHPYLLPNVLPDVLPCFLPEDLPRFLPDLLSYFLP